MVASGPAAAKPALAGLPREHLAGLRGGTGSRRAGTPPQNAILVKLGSGTGKKDVCRFGFGRKGSAHDPFPVEK